MKTVRMLSVMALSAGFLFTSCGTTMISQETMMKIEKGMSKENVISLLGKPDFRSFDQNIEDWEYRRAINGNGITNGRNGVMVVSFENGVVCAMETFEDVNHPTVVVAPDVAPVGGDLVCPPNRNDEASFNRLYQMVKDKPFKSDQMELIKAGTANGRFSCKQCARMMGLYTFDSDRLEVLKYFAPRIYDKDNVGVILDGLSFMSSRDKALDLLRGRK